MTETSRSKAAMKWASALRVAMLPIPRGLRRDVLRRVIDIADGEVHGELLFVTASEMQREPVPSKELSVMIQVLTRHIVNTHSPGDAAKILFRKHHNGTGSGRLFDYLPRGKK